MEAARCGKEWEVGGGKGELEGGKGELEGGKGELLVKGEARVEAGGRVEDSEGCVGRGLLKGVRLVETEAEPTEQVPGRDGVPDSPMVIGGALTVRGGTGLAGGVVSMPLSSIIFSAEHLHSKPTTAQTHSAVAGGRRGNAGRRHSCVCFSSSEKRAPGGSLRTTG